MHSPDHEMDLEISSGEIASSIPEVKQAAVTAMSKNYASDADALNGISASHKRFLPNELSSDLFGEKH